MGIDAEKMRTEVFNLSDDELDDELTRPTGNWKEDVLRESLRRTLRWTQFHGSGKVKV